MDLKHTAPCTEAGIWEGARVWTPIDGVGIVVEVAPEHTYGITVAFPRRPDGRQPEPLGYLLRDLRLDLTHGPTRLWAEALRKAPDMGSTDFDIAAPHAALRRFVQGAGRGRLEQRRWAHVCALTGYGSTYAQALCRWADLDPDEVVGVCS